MAYESVKIRDVVDRAVNHVWSIPEFQRGFVWKATQVRDLVESLWLNYPIGSLLVWDSGTRDVEERNVTDGVRPTWLVDGQQRATALSILSGRKPYWWTDGELWDKTIQRYDIRFDVEATDEPYFIVANVAIRKAKGDRYIAVRRLLVLDVDKRQVDRETLQALAKEIKIQGLCDGQDAMTVYSRLYEIATIREHDVPVVVIDHDLEDVVEIFARLNSRGTRVTEADIYLGVVAARSPAWCVQRSCRSASDWPTPDSTSARTSSSDALPESAARRSASRRSRTNSGTRQRSLRRGSERRSVGPLSPPGSRRSVSSATTRCRRRRHL